MRILVLGFVLVFLGACGVDEKSGESEADRLRREIVLLKEEKAKKEAREVALNKQLEDEAAQKVELLKELERVKPMVERVEEAERRVEEVEEMIKEVKKLK